MRRRMTPSARSACLALSLSFTDIEAGTEDDSATPPRGTRQSSQAVAGLPRLQRTPQRLIGSRPLLPANSAATGFINRIKPKSSPSAP